MRRISDGSLLRRFELPENGLTDASHTPHKPVPPWVNCKR
jgi:hypothetical protein